MKALNGVTLLLTIVGGVNWGVVAIGGLQADLVARLLGGSDSPASRVVYGLVGLSALWQVMPLIRSMRTNEVEAEGGQISRSSR